MENNKGQNNAMMLQGIKTKTYMFEFDCGCRGSMFCWNVLMCPTMKAGAAPGVIIFLIV